MRVKTLPLFIIGTLFAFGSAKPDARIAGGTAVTAQQYPFIVNLQHHVLSSWWAHQCGGSLITSRIAISAAACFYDTTASQWRARVGATAASGEGPIIPILRLTLHEQFDPITNDYDISIVILQTAAPTSPSIGTAQIAGSNYVLPENTIVSLLGWGRQSENGPYAQTLNHATAALLTQANCASIVNPTGRPISARMLCAAGLTADTGACAADWGGPLVHYNAAVPVLVGVLSWSHSCGGGQPFVSANVAELSTWILANAIV